MSFSMAGYRTKSLHLPLIKEEIEVLSVRVSKRYDGIITTIQDKKRRNKGRLMVVEGHWRDAAGPWAGPSRVRVIEVFEGPDVLYRLLIEREESYNSECARLVLRYFDLDNQSQRVTTHPFSAEYRKLKDGREHVSLTRGSVQLSLDYLRGHHVGTYLQDEIVRWARQWPGAIVVPISLSATDADDLNKMRRNRFYEQFGILFEYCETDRVAGISIPMLAVDLKPVAPEVWQQHIREYSLVHYMRRNGYAKNYPTVEPVDEQPFRLEYHVVYRRVVLWLSLLAIASIGVLL